ncbi:MAG: AAA family ATPase, partial [Lentisphaerota bacterium]
MLVKLSISNYVLIQNLEIDFTEGFSVITGETGAGKSILLGALALILGQRADSGVLLDDTRKCIIEGVFIIRGYNLDDFFNAHELDYEDSIILRREINQHGKSRAFINDTPVTLALLKDLGDRLVNVHSQNSIITLNDSNFQLAVLDNFAGLQDEVSSYRKGYHHFMEMNRQLAEIEEQTAKASGENDYFQFLSDELNLARLQPGEPGDIEEQLEMLTHAEEIKSSLYRANQLISGTDDNILSQLTETQHSINNIEKYMPELKNLVERIKINYIDIKDISNEFHVISEQVFVDPPRIETITQRLDHLNRLMKKHNVLTIEQLLVIQMEIEKRVTDNSNLEEQIFILRNEIASLEADLSANAERLSNNRQMALSEFEKDVTSILTRLGIPMARFKIEFIRAESMSKDGIDKVKFLFSANKGIELKDLSNTAS